MRKATENRLVPSYVHSGFAREARCGIRKISPRSEPVKWLTDLACRPEGLNVSQVGRALAGTAEGKPRQDGWEETLS